VLDLFVVLVVILIFEAHRRIRTTAFGLTVMAFFFSASFLTPKAGGREHLGPPSVY
jgi:hypothetical protein